MSVTIWCAPMLAICFESFVKLNRALWNWAIKHQSEEKLFRHSRVSKAPNVLEPKAPIVIRMSHKAASPGAKAFQPREPLQDQSTANTLPLVVGQYRYRPKAIPVRRTIGDLHQRKCDV